MTRQTRMRRGYAVRVQPRPAGYAWSVTGEDGRTATGLAPDPGSARLCCDFTIATLEALRRVSRRRF